MYDLFEQTQITIETYMPKENQKILLLDMCKINQIQLSHRSFWRTPCLSPHKTGRDL